MISVLLVLSSFAALAQEDKVAGLDKTVSVTGMMEGDALKLYQVLTWDDNSSYFKLAEGFTGLTGEAYNGIFATDEDAKTTREQEIVADIVDGITQTQANAIAGMTALETGAPSTKDTATIGEGGSYTYTLPKATGSENPIHSALGLYMAVITAGTPKYVYNPVFVSADFIINNTTGTLDASSANYTNSDNSAGVAKRKEITVNKFTADTDEGRTEDDQNAIIATAINSYVGQVVDFKVVTTIPVFLDSYKNPSFVIDDAIKTTGIDLVTGSIKVKLNTTEYTQYTVADTFTVVENPSSGDKKTGYTVTFDEKYLDANVTPVTVEITYKGKITNTANFNVNEDNNEVTVTYSNGPGTEKAALRDRTNHYTFSLGAEIYGSEDEHGKTYELVKVGVDAEGKPVVEKKKVSDWSSTTERHPLAGAEFGLYTDAACTTLYKNDLYSEGATFTTGADGVITFNGLAAGDYYLMEINAPTGYIKDTRKAHIKIEAEYKNVSVPATEENGIKIAGYDVEVLEWYKVTVNDVSVYDSTNDKYVAAGEPRVSTYTYDNKGPSIDRSKLTPAVNDSDLINTVGVELPSTGGMGTTILYIGGSILVILAAVLLITKRRMNAED